MRMRIIAAAFVLGFTSTQSVAATVQDSIANIWSVLAVDKTVNRVSLNYLADETGPNCSKTEIWAWARSPNGSFNPYEDVTSAEARELLPNMCDSGSVVTNDCVSSFKLIAKAKGYFGGSPSNSCGAADVDGFTFPPMVIPDIDPGPDSKSEPIFAAIEFNSNNDIVGVKAFPNNIGVVNHIEKSKQIVDGELLTEEMANAIWNGTGGSDDAVMDASEEELRAIIVTRPERNIPFSTVVRLGFEHRKAVRRVKNVRWEVSDDEGNSWNIATNLNGTPVTRSRISKRLTERQHLISRARYVLDGPAYNTEEGHVYALVEPKVRIDGPNVTYTSYPITLTGVITNGIPGDLKWQVFTNKDRKVPMIEQDGPSLTLQGLEFGGYIVKLLSTENPAYFEGHAAKGYAQQVVMVLPEKEVVEPEMKGLRNIKVGKTYHYTARLPGPFSTAKARHDLTISGVWTLPDGTTQDGPHLVVQPTAPGEIVATFTGKVDQLPHITVAGSLKLKATEYVWPAWVMTTEVKGSQVPVRVTAAVKMADVKAGRAGIGDEVPQYQWILPEGARVVSERGNLVIVDLAKAGDAQLQVKVFDTLGHETVVSSDTIPVAASDPDFQIDAVAAFADGNDLAPGRILFRLSVLKTPKNDAFKTFRVYDGETLLGETAQKILTLPFTNAGTYRLTLEAETKFGVIKQREVVVTLRPAPQPSCSLSLLGQTSLAWKLQAVCTVSEGTISAMDWAFGDRTSTGTAKLMEIRKADFPGGVDVTVTGTTNKGLSASASLRVDPPTQ